MYMLYTVTVMFLNYVLSAVTEKRPPNISFIV